MEEWKDVKGYEGLYQVSDLGNVRSLNYNRTGKVKELKPSTKNGYYFILLHKDGTRKNAYIHRLVAESFINNDDDLLVVNHIDGNKLNNSVDNLEWCTYSDNLVHAYNNELREINYDNIKIAHKAREKRIKCTTTGEEFNSFKEASERYGICRSSISFCCAGRYKYAGKLNGEKLHWEYI